MSTERKPNTGVLFKNSSKKYKEKGESLPKREALADFEKDYDFNGSATIEGKEFWVNGWVNVSKNQGQSYLALKFKRKEAK